MDLEGHAQRLAAVRVKASAPDGTARVVVDGTGRVVDLTLRAELLRRPPEEVAKTLLAALRKAQSGTQLPKLPEAMAKQIAADVQAAGDAVERRMAEVDAFLAAMRRGREAER